jgi:hypothetical protein
VLQLNAWQHVAATLDPLGNAIIYHNARVVGAGRTAVPLNVFRKSNYLGRSNWSADAAYAGRIDEVALYPTALSETRIRAHYQAAGYALPPGPPTSTYQTAVQADAPSAYWRLGETSGGVALDRSGQGRHATPVNGVALEAPGALVDDDDRAMTFDGVNDHLALPAGFADFPTGLTLEAWVYPTAVTTWARLLDLGNGPASNNIFLTRRATSNDLSLSIFNGGSDSGLFVVAPNVLRLNVWQHVAVTVTPLDATQATARIYYNGQQVANGTVLRPLNVTRASTYLGRSNWSGDAYFQGRLDEVAIYPSPLSAARLLAHYQAGTLPGSTSPYQTAILAGQPGGYWRVGEATLGGQGLADSAGEVPAEDDTLLAAASDPVLFDYSGQGRHGTARNGLLLGQPGALLGETNTAVTFDGIDDHISLPGGFDSFPTGLTVEAWIYPTANAYFARIIEFSSSTVGEPVSFARDSSSNDLTFHHFSGVPGGAWVTASDVLRLNVWQHVAATMDATGNVVIYHNGWVAGTGVIPPPRTVARNSNYIGKSNNGADAHFAGSMDEVAYYPRPLTAAEIRAHYMQGRPAITCPGGSIALGETKMLTLVAGQNAQCQFTLSQPTRLGVLIDNASLQGAGSTPGTGIQLSVRNPQGGKLSDPDAPVDVGKWGKVYAPRHEPSPPGFDKFTLAAQSNPYTIWLETASTVAGTINLSLVPITDPPPVVTRSWYVRTLDPATMEQLGRDTATGGAIPDEGLKGRLPNGGQVWLLFGAPWVMPPGPEAGQLGTKLVPRDPNDLNEIPKYASLAKITELSQAFMRGYYTEVIGVQDSQITVIVATSNDWLVGCSRCQSEHGAAWFNMVSTLDSWLPSLGSNARDSISRVHGGSDIEVDWNTKDVTIPWVQGYAQNYIDASTQPWLFVIGEIAGCNPQSNELCNNGWERQDILYVNWTAPPARPVPQIYSGVNALQWRALKRFSNHSMYFIGAAGPRPGETVIGWHWLWSTLSADPATQQIVGNVTGVNYGPE